MGCFVWSTICSHWGLESSFAKKGNLVVKFEFKIVTRAHCGQDLFFGHEKKKKKTQLGKSWGKNIELGQPAAKPRNFSRLIPNFVVQNPSLILN